ncbi:insulinase family protein [Candidatus Woesebacteria bacterium]|nr:insulinase family protein [Candidatus Woesebacteria bacterium]
MSPEISRSQETPFIKEVTWPNGFKLLLHHIPHSRFVTGRLSVKAGPRYEKISRVGVHHYIEHLLPAGTPKHPNYLSLFTFLANKGMQPDWETNYDNSSYHLKTKKEYAGEIIPYLFDLTRKPRFYKKDRTRERKRVNEEILEYIDDPEEDIENIFMKKLFEFFPVGAGVLGKKDSLKRVEKRAILEQEHRAVYRPNNEVFVFVGDFVEKNIVDQVGQTFGKLRNPRSSLRLDAYPTPVYRPNGKHVVVKHRDDLKQVQVLLGFPIEKSLVEKYYYETALLHTMIWKSINFKLIEKYGTGYHLRGGAWLHSDFGTMFFKISVRKRNVPFVVETMVREINQQNFGQVEMSLMKNFEKGSSISDLDNTNNMAEYILNSYLSTGNALSIDGLEKRVDLIRPEDTKMLHRKIFTKDNAILALEGDVSRDEIPKYEQKLQFGR